MCHGFARSESPTSTDITLSLLCAMGDVVSLAADDQEYDHPPTCVTKNRALGGATGGDWCVPGKFVPGYHAGLVLQPR